MKCAGLGVKTHKRTNALKLYSLSSAILQLCSAPTRKSPVESRSVRSLHNAASIILRDQTKKKKKRTRTRRRRTMRRSTHGASSARSSQRTVTLTTMNKERKKREREKQQANKIDCGVGRRAGAEPARGRTNSRGTRYKDTHLSVQYVVLAPRPPLPSARIICI